MANFSKKTILILIILLSMTACIVLFLFWLMSYSVINGRPQVLWQRDARSFANLSDDFNKDTLYIRTNDGLAAVDLNTGEEMQKYTLQLELNTVGPSINSDISIAGLFNNHVYLKEAVKKASGYEYALVDTDENTGKEGWRFIASSIDEVFISPTGEIYAIVDTNAPHTYVVKINKETGAELWRTPLNPVGGIKLISDKGVYVVDYDKVLSAFDPQTGIKKWSTPRYAYELSHPPRLINGKIQFTDGTVVDEDTGGIDVSEAQPMTVNNQVLNKIVTPNTTYISGFASGTDLGFPFFCIDTCPVTIRATDTKTGELKWKWTTRGYEFQVVNGVAYILGNGKITAIK